MDLTVTASSAVAATDDTAPHSPPYRASPAIFSTVPIFSPVMAR